MTIIAWDGKTLAADKQSSYQGFSATVTKIHLINGALVGACGNAAHARALIDWVKNGRKLENRPKPFTENSSADLIYIAKGEKILEYNGLGGGFPDELEDSHTASGCGRDCALAAMYLGCDARRAVEVACALNIYCGQGIDTLEFP